MSASSSPPSTRPSRDECCCEWQGCSVVASHPEQLYIHLCNDHIGRKSTNNLCLSCKWKGCNTTCAKRDHITSHLRVHTPLKPHVCEICNKTFKRPQDLKKHEKIHTEEHHSQHKHSKAITVSDPGFSVKTRTAAITDVNRNYSSISGPNDYRPRHAHMENGYYHDNRRGVAGVPYNASGDHEALTQTTVPDVVLDSAYSTSRQSRSNLSGEIHAKRSHDTMEDFLHDVKRRKYSPTYDASMVERLSALSNFSQLSQAQAHQAAHLDNANGLNAISHQMSSNGFDSAQPPAFNPGAVPNNLEELAMVNAFLIKLSEQISANTNANNAIPNVNGQQPSNSFGNMMTGTSGFGAYGPGFGTPMAPMGGFGLLPNMGSLGTLGLGGYSGHTGLNSLSGFASGLEALGGLAMVSPTAYQSALVAAIAAAAAMSQHGHHAAMGAAPNPYMDLSSIAALAGIPGLGRQGQQGTDMNPPQVMSNPLLLQPPQPSLQQVHHTQPNAFGLQAGFSPSYPNGDAHALPSFDGHKSSASGGTDGNKRASMSVVHDRSKRSRRESPARGEPTFSGSRSLYTMDQLGGLDGNHHISSPQTTSTTTFSESASSRSSTSSPSLLSASASDHVSSSPETFSVMRSKGRHMPAASSRDFGGSFDPSTAPFGTDHHVPNSGAPTSPNYDLDTILGENRDTRVRGFNHHVPRLGVMEAVGSTPILRDVPKLQSSHPAYRSSSSLGEDEEAMNVGEEKGIAAKIGRVRPMEPKIHASGPSTLLPVDPRRRTASSSKYPSRGYPDPSLRLPAIRPRTPSISSHSTSSKDTDETRPSYDGDEKHCSNTTPRPCTPRLEVHTPTATQNITLPGVRSIFDPSTTRHRPVDRLASDIDRINIASRPSTSSSTTSAPPSAGSASQEEKWKHLNLIRRLFIWINEDFSRRHRRLVDANYQAIQQSYEKQRANGLSSSELSEQRTPIASSSGTAHITRPDHPALGYDSDEDIAMESDDESVRVDSHGDVEELEDDSDGEEFPHSVHRTVGVDLSRLPLPILRPVRA